MTNPAAPDSISDLKESLRDIARRCSLVGRVLAKHKTAQTRLQKRIKIASFCVAGVVTIFGFVIGMPQVKAVVGDGLPLVVGVLGAGFLLMEAYTPSVLDDPNPERFGDYSKYILRYSRTIDELLHEKKLSEADWFARAWVLYEWSRDNLDDITEKWPWIEDRLRIEARSLDQDADGEQSHAPERRWPAFSKKPSTPPPPGDA
jgi:hypothetical protein